MYLLSFCSINSLQYWLFWVSAIFLKLHHTNWMCQSIGLELHVQLSTFVFLPFAFQGLLQACNELCANYLFQPDKQYDVTYDTGDKTIQCGRHVDVFKLWLMWKAKVSCLIWIKITVALFIGEFQVPLYVGVIKCKDMRTL